MKLKTLLYLFVFVSAFGSHAIIVRHDVAPGDYEIRSSDFPAVFFLQREGARRICGATVIHERWAITAAHCIYETNLGNSINNGRNFTVEVANEEREIDAVYGHPAITDKENPEVDLALLRFSKASSVPWPMQVSRDSNEVGKVVTLVGWGYFGIGTTGRQYADSTKRRAHNRIVQADSKLRFIFDDPRILDSSSLPLEGSLGLGDSGGPALIETKEGYHLVGVAIGEAVGDEYSEETQGKYGAIAVYERISLHIDWIDSVFDSEG